MDGNRRWSKKNNVSKIESYQKGALKILSLSNYIFNNYNILLISAFALSFHNFKRPKSTTKILINVFQYFIETFESSRFNFKIKILGDLNFLDKEMLIRINKLQNKNNDALNTLILFVNYSGKKDIENAALNCKKNDLFNKYLSTKFLPDPDILVRTGGYKRISDFLLYQLSFTELFFLDKLWPDITYRDIRKIINNFIKIDRNFGV